MREVSTVSKTGLLPVAASREPERCQRADRFACSPFAFASAANRAQVGDSAKLMSVVLAGYPMLAQPAATSFFVPEWADGAVLQRVQLKDRAGRLWTAAYQLQRQADATWRINGCAVAPDSGNSST